MAAVDSVIKELDAFGKQTLIVSTRSISWKIRIWPRPTAEISRQCCDFGEERARH